MSGVASLPMYDLPELRPQTERLWQAVRDAMRERGLDAPERLDQPQDLAQHWRDPALLLSQTCGYPLLSLRDHVRVVATPVYDAPGCEGACYRSVIIVRRDDDAAGLSALRGRGCAVNAWNSNSGMNLLRASVAPLAAGRAFFRSVAITGSHAASIASVACGDTDVAAIDCVTFALLSRHRPELTAPVRILDWTVACPGLPLVTAADAGVRDVLRAALDAVAPVPALLIRRFEVLPADAYDAIRAIEDGARAAGYPVLA